MESTNIFLIFVISFVRFLTSAHIPGAYHRELYIFRGVQQYEKDNRISFDTNGWDGAIRPGTQI
jgi:hypothetical protein